MMCKQLYIQIEQSASCVQMNMCMKMSWIKYAIVTLCIVLNEQEAVADTLEQLWISYNQIEKLKGITVLKKMTVSNIIL